MSEYALSSYSYYSNQVVVSGRRSTLAHQIHYNLREYVIRGVGSESSDWYKNQTTSYISSLIKYEDAIISGSSNLGTKQIQSSTQTSIHYEDACSSSLSIHGLNYNSPSVFNVNDCSSFYNGVLGQGLHQGIEEYVSLVRRVISTMETTNSTTTALSSTEYILVEELQRLYLPHIILSSTTDFMNDGSDDYTVSRKGINIVCLCFGLASIFIYIGYRATTRRLEMVLKHNRTLPLIIPFEIALEIDVVKEFYFKESDKLLE